MTDRPNIILIMTDQQRYDSISALGFPYMTTPNLDRLVREGVTLTNCHITAASCVPCRASLFKGYYPHTTGVLRNGQPWGRTWVESLAAAGYRCVNVGKMHTIPYDADAGFHERYVVENKDRYMEGRWYFDEWDKALAAHGLKKQQRELYRQRADYRERLGAFDWELPEHLHSDMFVGNMAKWWVDTYPVTEPLFLQVGFPGPHPPYDPIPRYAEPYLARNDLPVPSPSAEELDALPPPLKEKRQHDVEVDHDLVVWSLDPRPDQLHRMWANYCANVTMIDEKIGELLESLRARGYLDNAVVFFCSDHGDCMGDHGLIQKWSMYEEVTRSPVIAWSPGRFAGGTAGGGPLPALRPGADDPGACRRRGAGELRGPIAARRARGSPLGAPRSRVLRAGRRRQPDRLGAHHDGPLVPAQARSFQGPGLWPALRSRGGSQGDARSLGQPRARAGEAGAARCVAGLADRERLPDPRLGGRVPVTGRPAGRPAHGREVMAET